MAVPLRTILRQGQKPCVDGLNSHVRLHRSKEKRSDNMAKGDNKNRLPVMYGLCSLFTRIACIAVAARTDGKGHNGKPRASRDARNKTTAKKWNIPKKGNKTARGPKSKTKTYESSLSNTLSTEVGSQQPCYWCPISCFQMTMMAHRKKKKLRTSSSQVIWDGHAHKIAIIERCTLDHSNRWALSRSTNWEKDSTAKT